MTSEKPGPNKLPRALWPLITEKRWLVWKAVRRGGKLTKVPINPHTGHPIDAHKPRNWLTYDEACRLCRQHGDGIGYSLAGEREIAALDCDKCRNKETGAIAPWAQELIARARSYTEVTPSQTGVRIIGWADGASVHDAKIARPGGGALEIYFNTRRYITVTGDQLGDCTALADISALIAAEHAKARPQRQTGGAVGCKSVAANATTLKSFRCRPCRSIRSWTAAASTATAIG
jgi:putative DNA primase/helicase